ncbi:MAG: glycosyltransferase family 4 protein [Armatimonadota bacterium]
MKALFLVRDLPWPTDSGARIRSHNLAVRMAARHDVTIVGYSGAYARPEPPEPTPLRNIVAVPEPSRVQGLRLLLQLAASTLSPLPYAVSKHLSQAMSDAVHSLLASDQFDLVHCDSLPLAPYAASSGTPKVLDEHNVEWTLWWRHARFTRTIPAKAYALLQAVRMRRFEADVCRLFDECVTVSELDAERLRQTCPLASISVAPNGVDAHFFQSERTPPVLGRLVFVGSMDWMPNQDGIRWFATRVWPRLHRRCPHATLVVVGRRPSDQVKALASKHGFLLVPDAPDVRPHVAQAEVYIVPLRVGGGTRLKILEALAMEKPVVSTSVGAEGLDVVHGTHLLIADDPNAFAEAVEQVLTDRALARNLATAGRELVADNYNWDRIADMLDRVWERARNGINVASTPSDT